MLASFTHPQFNGPLSGTTQVSRYQKGKTNLDFTEARDSEWQWHQLDHMQVCTSLQTDNHASTSPLSFFTGRMPFLPPNQQRQSTEGMIWSELNSSCVHMLSDWKVCIARTKLEFTNSNVVWTVPLEYMCPELEFNYVQCMWCERGLTRSWWLSLFISTFISLRNHADLLKSIICAHNLHPRHPFPNYIQWSFCACL